MLSLEWFPIKAVWFNHLTLLFKATHQLPATSWRTSKVLSVIWPQDDSAESFQTTVSQAAGILILNPLLILISGLLLVTWGARSLIFFKSHPEGCLVSKLFLWHFKLSWVPFVLCFHMTLRVPHLCSDYMISYFSSQLLQVLTVFILLYSPCSDLCLEQSHCSVSDSLCERISDSLKTRVVR